MRNRIWSAIAPVGLILLLAGCNQTEQAITPLAADVEEAQAAAGTAQASGISLRFTPIIGAPIEAITPLSRQLAAEAQKRGFPIHASTEQAGTHILKGYLSAFNDGSQTTVVFVWDVLDPVGARLHRIQGQESVEGSSSDAWSIVTPAAMEKVATRVFDEYQAWLARTQQQ
ncbi:MAG: hypothetical protein CML29_15895 [Rhizobiales bacterium]|nr:hypothetical protein [Hyphomicrobiales bacterium]MBA70297.1 hypothetical protein [Hyphomicrobiales bacterium]|tara:strand:+ start:526 stop:1038 length:513 start_codon:yes stop_codon:yes gene_type:complete